MSNITRVTVRSISNQNLNRTESRQTPDHRPRSGSSLSGSIHSHVIVTPISSSHCQLTPPRHPSMDQQIDLRPSNTIRSSASLADALCRRSHDPLAWMTRGLCCNHCRPLCYPMMPMHHIERLLPSSMPQETFHQEKDTLRTPEQSPPFEHGSEALQTSY
jgi:hypothetical protein